MDTVKSKTISINDQIVAIAQQAIKLRQALDSKPVPKELIDDFKILENSLTRVSEVSIPFEQRFSHLQALAGMGQVINSTLEIDEVLQIVMDTIIRLMGAERGFLMLRDERSTTAEMSMRIARNWEQESINKNEFAISRTVVQRVIESGEAILTTNAREDPRFGGQERSSHLICARSYASFRSTQH
jgi:transcriptional regulator with GAF, ATPase, and Fis domain